MNFGRLFLFTSLVLSTLCLAGGYALAGQWTGAWLALLLCPVWLTGWKYRLPLLVYACMTAVVCLAAAGLLLESIFWLMIAGLGFGLAAWDGLLLEISFCNVPAGQNKEAARNKHLQSLALATGVGLVVAIPLHWVNLRIPFIVMLLLVILAGLGILRVWEYLKKRRLRAD